MSSRLELLGLAVVELRTAVGPGHRRSLGGPGT